MCGNEVNYATVVLRSGLAAPYIPEFERAVAETVGRRYAVAVSSGTAALHLALEAAGVEPGDRVIVPDLTFIATANAVRHTGAWPIFMDVSEDTWQVNLDMLRETIATRCVWKRGQLFWSKDDYQPLKAIVVVPLLGYPLNLGDLPEFLEERGIVIVEDAAQALGAIYKGFSAGKHGVAGTFSMNTNKVVTAAGGGMVVTDDEHLAWLVRHNADQCRNRDHADEFMHTSVGYNYRMSNLQAAVGVAQMEKLGEHLQQKRAIAGRYMQGLKGVPGVSFPTGVGGQFSNVMPSCWLNVIRIGHDSRPLIKHLREQGIEASAIYQPLHMSRAYTGCEHVGGNVASAIWKDAVCLPSGAGLKLEQVDEVVAEVRGFLSEGGE
jgi:dTDP-4-amino-4,6-dideoxygalactose transaminase